MQRSSGIIGCLAAFIAIALGAFGAHALKDVLTASDTLEVWRTAVNYHMWHALALVACALFPGSSRAKATATTLFIAGILLFSGSLYWLALEGPRWLGPITPLGGLSFMGGWIALGTAFFKSRN